MFWTRKHSFAAMMAASVVALAGAALLAQAPSTGGLRWVKAAPFPEPGDVTKGLWAEDGYWESEPGRGGGTGD